MNPKNIKQTFNSKSLTKFQNSPQSMLKASKKEPSSIELIRKNFMNLGISKSPIHKDYAPMKLEGNCNSGINNEMLKEWQENEAKLNDTLKAFSMQVRRNEGSSANTLFRTRTVLLNWLKDSDNLEYSQFMTEKKIRYLLRHKENLEGKMKALLTEVTNLKQKRVDLENILGDQYITYETEELAMEIERFSQSYEIKSGKSSKMLEKFEEMKRMFDSVKEYNLIKEQESNKTQEIKEIKNIIKTSLQTLENLKNYYKNLKVKITNLIVNVYNK
jgi:hypothetical protein